MKIKKLTTKYSIARDKTAAEAHSQYGGLLARSGRTDEARAQLDEALAIAEESGAPGAHVSALLNRALLTGGDPAEALAAFAQAEQHMHHEARTESRFLLFRATGDKEHIEAAHKLLTFRVEHTPEQYRETTITNVRLHRDIEKAWEECLEAG